MRKPFETDEEFGTTRTARSRIPRRKREQEFQVTEHQLPKVRDLPQQAAQGIMLGRVGCMLREQYKDLLKQPVPDRLADLIRQLA